MSLTDAQQRVDAWISQYEEGYFQPLTNLARLTEEVGELAREVNHRFGQKTKKREEAEGDLAMEMADILFVLVCMANREGIDLQAGFDRMMMKVETRDRDRWTKKGGQAVGRMDRRTGGLADRRSGGQADRRSGGQADRRSVDQADGWADDR
jgi:NTP pyrophosphatase (non-canonical NTP hydrolase)